MESYQRKLIEGAIAGNKDDLEALLNDSMRNILHLSILHSNKQEAEDIAQEVAFVMCKKINTLSDPSKFLHWLSVVIRNVSVDHMRKIYQMNETVEFDEDIDVKESMMDLEFLPEKYVENAELRSVIIEEINSLPKTQELCLSYYYLEEFKRADIAEATGLTPRQVSTALNNGKQTLKKVLEQRFGKSFAYSAVPVGTIPALARVFTVRRDEMISADVCEQICQAVLGRLNGALVVSQGSVLSTNVVVCTIAAVAAAGVAVYAWHHSSEQPAETMPPPVIEIQQEAYVEQEEADREIRTVADMIGADAAVLLEWFVENGADASEWDDFVEGIGIARDTQVNSIRNTYTTYLLEKQNKRLLLARQDSQSGEIRILYLFGDKEEPQEQITSIILLFTE